MFPNVKTYMEAMTLPRPLLDAIMEDFTKVTRIEKTKIAIKVYGFDRKMPITVYYSNHYLRSKNGQRGKTNTRNGKS